jgi:hypothetical protein
MSKLIEAYKLGEIQVTITENPEISTKVDVVAVKGDKEMRFTARHSEYVHYNRLMNRRISEHFKS